MFNHGRLITQAVYTASVIIILLLGIYVLHTDLVKLTSVQNEIRTELHNLNNQTKILVMTKKK